MRIFLAAFALLAACSSTETSPSVTDSSSSSESGAIVGCAENPKTGDACAIDGTKCDHPIDCGPTAGTFGTCVSGVWRVVNNPCTTGDSGTDAAHD